MAERNKSAPVPWQAPLAVEDVPEEGRHVDLTADVDTRAEVARVAGLRDLPRFEAKFDVTHHRQGGLHVCGQVSATVGQTCVVTLEPLANEIEEDVDLVFLPDAAKPKGDLGPAPEDGAAETDPLIGGSVDLGAIATEFLILGIDPYPRKPGAVFSPPQEALPDEGPFAALAALKKERGA